MQLSRRHVSDLLRPISYQNGAFLDFVYNRMAFTKHISENVTL
jgi:hypothetical protein